ncbi:MAG: GNAT family N-acetyltransferase [Bacteroidetes bacterium]|nr:GNAT family N-acetyltransferase [Bacteroidota bacterium]
MNEIIWTCKHFKDLTNEELYEIFRLRVSVFVVEQNCPYQDADGKDLKAFHVTGKQNEELIAYARIVFPNVSYKEVSIGRVITSKEARRTGAGKILMEKSMKFIKKEFGKVPVRIGAQLYLQKFYEGFGFVREGSEYLEDGIPHIIMLAPIIK